MWTRPPKDLIVPWEWRKRRSRSSFTDHTADTVEDCVAALGGTRRPASTPSPVKSNSGECLIKGNISGSGRIYHVPGAPSYEATVISERKG